MSAASKRRRERTAGGWSSRPGPPSNQDIRKCFINDVSLISRRAHGIDSRRPVVIPTLGAQRASSSPDDPIQRDPETQDASKVQEWEIGLTPDLLAEPVHQPATPNNVPAQNVNTADEVPDSDWFTNRIYATPLTIDEIRGPNDDRRPRPRKVDRHRRKGAGVAPGFTVRDEKGEVWFAQLRRAATIRWRRPQRSRSPRNCSGRSDTSRSRTTSRRAA